MLHKCNFKNESQFFLQSRRFWSYHSVHIIWVTRANKFPLSFLLKELSFPPTLLFQRGSNSDYFNIVLRKIDKLNAIKLKTRAAEKAVLWMYFFLLSQPCFYCIHPPFCSTFHTNMQVAHFELTGILQSLKSNCRIWPKYSYGTSTTTWVDCLYFFFSIVSIIISLQEIKYSHLHPHLHLQFGSYLQLHPWKSVWCLWEKLSTKKAGTQCYYLRI